MKPDYKKFIAELTKREGKKNQVNTAQMREIVGVIADIMHEEWMKDRGISVINLLAKLGVTRAAKKKVKAAK